MSEGEAPGRHHVQSFARGLSVIRAFDAEHPRRTLSEVARTTGLTRAAARRFLLTLVDLGYVTTDGQRFELTPRVLDLGYAYLSGLSLPELSQPHLERVVAETQESSSVSVLDGADIVYVARVAMSRIMTVAINVGTRFPAHATSMGQVLLADLDEPSLTRYLEQHRLDGRTVRTLTEPAALRARLGLVHEQGYALVDEELEIGLRAIAAPIRSHRGRVVAAINISTQSGRISTEAMTTELLPALREAAKRIEADLASAEGVAAGPTDAAGEAGKR